MPNFRNWVGSCENSRDLLKQLKLLLSCRMVCSVNRKELCKYLCCDGLRQKAAFKIFRR